MSKTDIPAAAVGTPRAPLWRRRPKLIGSLLVLGVGLTAFFIYYSTDSRAKLEEAFAEADQSDPGWRLPELQASRRAVPDKENSALVLMSAHALMPPRWPVWQDKSFPENSARSEAEIQAFQKAFSNAEPAFQLSDGELKLLQEEIKRAAPALAEARKILDLPHGRYPLEFAKDYISTPLPHAQDARGMANLFAYDAMLHAQEKDLDGALVDCRGIVRVNDSIGDEPTMISMFVRMAIRQLALRQIEHVLAQGQASEASLAAIQHLLEEEEKEPLLLIGLRGERAVDDGFMQALQNGDISSSQLPRLVENMGGTLYSLEGARLYLLPGAVNYERAALLKWNNITVARAKSMPVEGQRPALEKQELSALELPGLARLLHSSWSKIGKPWLQDQASVRCAITIVACERYRLAHGNWPKAASELVPTYLAKVPADLYTARPLRIRRIADGVSVSSPAESNNDALMAVNANAARPAAPPTEQESSFRLWDVSSRRRPPEKSGK
jgi:hypothetical protein